MGGISRLAAVEFAENPEPRCPCVLLLDTSSSMYGEPIAALNQGLITFRNDLMKDPLARRRVELAVVTFDDKVVVVQDFVTADQFRPPTLVAEGSTSMGGGIVKALDLVAARKATYKPNGIQGYRPWVFMITDGGPTDRVSVAKSRIESDEKNKHVIFFAVGVEGACMDLLAKLSVRQPVKLTGLNFDALFLWLSRSTQAVSHSRVGEQVALPPIGWGVAE